MKFTPFHDRVLVLPDDAAPKRGGLSQPSSQKEEATIGTVVAAGPEALYMPQILAGVQIGWRVQWAKYAGREVFHEGVRHQLLRLEELDGRLEEQ